MGQFEYAIWAFPAILAATTASCQRFDKIGQDIALTKNLKTRFASQMKVGYDVQFMEEL